MLIGKGDILVDSTVAFNYGSNGRPIMRQIWSWQGPAHHAAHEQKNKVRQASFVSSTHHALLSHCVPTLHDKSNPRPCACQNMRAAKRGGEMLVYHRNAFHALLNALCGIPTHARKSLRKEIAFQKASRV